MTLCRPLAALALTLAGCAAPPAVDPGLADRLDAAVTGALRDREIPGGALVVVREGRVIHSRGYGVADLATGEPVTDSTPFVIGSTSKPITAMAVLRLVAQGRVALDTPVVRYLPDLAFADSRGAAITLRHLLTNRSGMVVGYAGPAFASPPVRDDSALAREVGRAVALPLLFAPGEGYAYSNRGWALAGYVVQRVSGMPVEAFLERELFGPLQMTGTTLAFWTVPGIAQGYREGRRLRNHPAPPAVTRAYGPAGMVVSTARDVGRLLADLTADRSAVLPPELVAEMFRAQAEAESEFGGPTRYSLGWEVDSLFGVPTIRKAGSVGTLVSLWVLLPGTRTAFGLFFNREDYQVLPLAGHLIRILAGDEAPAFTSAPAPPFEPPAAVPVDAAERRRWTGEYDTRYGELSVLQRGDSLLARFEGTEAALAPQGGGAFVLVTDLVGRAGMVLRFRRQGDAVTAWLGGDSLGIRVAAP